MLQYQKKVTPDRPTKGGHTDIPIQIKRRIEQNTSVALDDVKIHYNSDRPAELGALAFTRGTQVYLGPGQEEHLPHELGHVVQQKLGLVRPDTRHPGGALMNTDMTLERQADRIGAGMESVRLYSGQYPGRPVVQRMSVFEGRRGTEPVISRYKRSGWIALQNLKKYFTEESIQRASVKGLERLSRDEIMPKLDAKTYFSGLARREGKQGKFEYSQGFKDIFNHNITEFSQAELRPFHKWNQEGDRFQTVLEECQKVSRAGFDSTTEEDKEYISASELKKKGQYQKVDSMVDPYFNYKKQALYCIAHKASMASGDDVGPHIAVTVAGKRIYVANNTHYALHGKKIGMPELLHRVREAVNQIKKEDIVHIMRNERGYSMSGAPFEQQKTMNPPVAEIMKWIDEIRNYPIAVLDAPQYRAAERYKMSPIHGEMMIMSYLGNQQRLLDHRKIKLEEAKGIVPGARRVLWIGGTRVDCIVCHEHFDQINRSDSIPGNYVVSSQKVGTDGHGKPFPGTEHGTDPASKGGLVFSTLKKSMSKDSRLSPEQIDSLRKRVSETLKIEEVASEGGTGA